MSRHEIRTRNHPEHPNCYAAYGYDHPLQGYFFQIFRRELILDVATNEILGDLRPQRVIADLMADWDAPREHIEAIMLDLPIPD